MIPEAFRDVVAFIYGLNDLGVVKWYEVVYHDGKRWRSYSDSKTFEDGEEVIKWTYAVDILYDNMLRPDLDAN